MKILSLIIKQVYFDLILSGEKKVETREVKPTTQKKYVVLNEADEITEIIQYDAIRFFVGYNTNRATALIEVTGAEIFQIVDENDKQITYDYKGQEQGAFEIEYSLGKILEQ